MTASNNHHLADLLTQARPEVATRRALVVVDLQNDFGASGKLPLTWGAGFGSLADAVAHARAHGFVAWVRSEYQDIRPFHPAESTAGGDPVIQGPNSRAANQPQDDDDDEDEFLRAALAGKSSLSSRTAALMKRAAATSTAPLQVPREMFLSQLSGSADPDKQCCMPDSDGAHWIPELDELIDERKDLLLTKSSYSAFGTTSLLQTLRSRLVTELYICGAHTNVSVYATAAAAVQHGMRVTLIEDCCGYLDPEAHEEAMAQMSYYMGINVVSSAEFPRASPHLLHKKPSQLLHPASQATSRPPTNRLETGGASVPLPAAPLNHPDFSVPSPGSSAAKGSRIPRRVSSGGFHASKLPTRSASRASSGRDSPAPGVTRPASRQVSRSKTMSPVSDDVSMDYVNIPPTAQEEDEDAGSVSPTDSSYGASQRDSSMLGSAGDVTLQEAVAEEDESGEAGRAHPDPPGSLAEPPELDPIEKHDEHKEQEEQNELALAEAPAAKARPEPLIDSTNEPADDFIASRASAPRTKEPLLDLSGREETGEPVGDGDSELFLGALDDLVSDDAFVQIKNEVRWQKMLHASGEVPRLVCAQGVFGADGSMPVYRHPSDHSLPLLHFSPTVDAIRRRVERLVGHSLNHCLVQLYRHGHDFISEHSDKTLDIVRGSFIVNASIGAQRTMRLRTKRKIPRSREISDSPSAGRDQVTVPLPHGSVFLLGPHDNARYLHGIKQDKRLDSERSEEERLYNGERVSLTFRYIGTHLSSSSSLIWGQGASGKTRADAQPVINNDPAETQRIINAFGLENQQTHFDWQAIYGSGFDVLHFRDAPNDNACTFFPSVLEEQNLAIKLFFHEFAVSFGVAGVSARDAGAGHVPQLCIRDSDFKKTEVCGFEEVLIYLDREYGSGRASRVPNVDVLRLILDLARLKRASPRRLLEALEKLLADQRAHLAGPAYSAADCAYWPVVDETMEEYHDLAEFFPHVHAYHERLSRRDSVVQTLWAEAAEQ